MLSSYRVDVPGYLEKITQDGKPIAYITSMNKEETRFAGFVGQAVFEGPCVLDVKEKMIPYIEDLTGQQG